MARYCKNCNQNVAVEIVSSTNEVVCAHCGSPVSPDNILSSGTIIGGFMIECELGRGGMGVVYRATQVNLERPVALKVMSEALSRDPNFVDGFFREARAAASLSHPHIVQAYDAGATPDGIYYFAMELIDGETVDSRIMRKGALPMRDALDISHKISQALAYAWERQKLCHGDIKPENIILNSSGSAKLADLGLAKSYKEESASEHELMATPLYAPPEVIRGQRNKIGFKSDMYSFGATLYHMFAGVPPFQGDDPNVVCERQLNEQPKPLISVRKGVPSSLSCLVDKLMEKDPDKRPESWSEVAERLEHILESVKFKHGHVETVSLHLSDRGKPAGRKSHAFLVVLLVAGLLAAGGVFAAFKMKSARKQTVVTPPAAASSKTGNPIENEWQELKVKLHLMPSGEAITAINDFVKRAGKSAPSEAADILTEYQVKHSFEQLSAPFVKGVETFLSEAKSGLKNIGIDRQQALVSQADSLIKQLEKNPSLQQSVGTDKVEKIKNTRNELNSSLSKHRADVAAKQKEEAERAMRDRDAAEKKKEQAAELRKRLASENKGADELSRLICTIFTAKEKDAAVLVSGIDEWKKKYPQVRKETAELASVARGLAASGSISWYQLFTMLDGAVKGLNIPNDIAPDYTIDSFDEKAIKLVFNDGKVVLGKKLQWNAVKNEQYAVFLKNIMSSAEFKKMPVKTQYSLISKAVFCLPPKSIIPGVENSTLKKNEISGIIGFLQMVDKASMENDAMNSWNELQKKIADNFESEAAVMLEKFIRDYSETSFYARYQPEIAEYSEKYKSVAAVNRIRQGLDDIKNFKAKGELRKALHFASSAFIRYGMNATLPGELRQDIADSRKSILDDLERVASDESRPVRGGGRPAFFPVVLFLSMDDEKPGNGYLYARRFFASRLNPGGDGHVPMFEFTSGLDVGLWDNVRRELEDRNFRSGWGGSDRSTFTTLSVFYGMGLMAQTFQLRKVSDNITSRYSNMLDGRAASDEPEQNSNVFLMSGMEYALLIRSDSLADKILGKVDLKQTDDRSMKQLSRLLLPYILNKMMGGLPENAFNDVTQCFPRELQLFKLVISRLLYTENVAMTSQEESNLMRVLISAPASSGARLIMESVAKASCQNRLSGQTAKRLSEAVLDTSRPSAWDFGISSSELWKKAVLLELADSDSYKVMQDRVESALADNRICAMTSYARLMILNAALSVKNGISKPEAAFAALMENMKDSPMLSDSERRFIAEAGKNPLAIVKSLLANGYPEEAFYLGVAGMLADGSEKVAVAGMLSENENRFTWAERCFLKKLMQIEK